MLVMTRLEGKCPQRATLDGNEVTIGREKTNAITIDHPRVSRVHAAIHTMDDRHEIRDLGSTNGTYLNGQRVKVAPLRMGDVIDFANIARYLIGEVSDFVPELARRTAAAMLEIRFRTLELTRTASVRVSPDVERMRIGRSAGIEVSLPVLVEKMGLPIPPRQLRSVAPEHAALCVKGGRVFLLDLDSATGTYLQCESGASNPSAITTQKRILADGTPVSVRPLAKGEALEIRRETGFILGQAPIEFVVR